MLNSIEFFEEEEGDCRGVAVAKTRLENRLWLDYSEKNKEYEKEFFEFLSEKENH